MHSNTVIYVSVLCSVEFLVLLLYLHLVTRQCNIKHQHSVHGAIQQQQDNTKTSMNAPTNTGRANNDDNAIDNAD